MLTPKELTELLTLREWVSLCRWADLRKQAAPRKMMYAYGAEQLDTAPTIAGVVPFAKFDVLKVERLSDTVFVQVETEDGASLSVDLYKDTGQKPPQIHTRRIAV